MFESGYDATNPENVFFFYYISVCGNVGPVLYERIKSTFSSPEEFLSADEKMLKNTGRFSDKQIQRFIDVKKDDRIKREFDRMNHMGIKMIPIEDNDYPELLKDISDPPVVLFVKGKIPSKTAVNVGVIGARECSDYGKAVADRLGDALARAGVCVVSGMARGIDSLSQAAALRAGGSSIAVLGGGVDVIYPRESKALYYDLAKEGTIISEYPPGTMPQRQFFAMRNRIISGISHTLAVIEAKEKSGTLITVDNALSQGRDVYTVPGRITDITSYGTNELIRQGAGIISDVNAFADEIVKRYGNYLSCSFVDAPNISTASKYSDVESAVIKNMGENSFTTDHMSSVIDIPSFELLGICMSLCEKNILSSLGAGRFRATARGIDIRNDIIKAADEKHHNDLDW